MAIVYAVDYQRLASQLIRALRGKRRQAELSRSLGYRSNVLSAWETGRDIPSLTTFFRLLRACGREPLQILGAFRPLPQDFDLQSGADRGRFLDTLRANRTILEIAEEVRMDRFVLSRVLQGKSDPRLHDFLELIEILTLSVVEFVSLIVEPSGLEEIAARAALQRKAREAAARFPWAQAVVLLVQLPEYGALDTHPKGWFASRLGTTISEETECLQMLVDLGRLSYCAGRYTTSNPALATDTRMDASLTRQQSAYWLRQAAARAEDGRAVSLSFNVFSVARSDMGALREIRDRYFAEMRALIAKSQPDEAAAVTLFSTFEL